MRSRPVSKPKRPRLLGPGTVLAVIAAIGIVAYGRIGEQTPLNPNTGQIAYEADAHGNMRKAGTAAPPLVMPPPLLKPEVALILQHTSDLRLGSSQTRQVSDLDAAWKQEKNDIEAAMRRAVSDADGRRRVAEANNSASAAQITSSLGDYSDLSHQFNDRRAFYWTQALALLTPEQRTMLERIVSTDGKRRPR